MDEINDPNELSHRKATIEIVNYYFIENSKANKI